MNKTVDKPEDLKKLNTLADAQKISVVKEHDNTYTLLKNLEELGNGDLKDMLKKLEPRTKNIEKEQKSLETAKQNKNVNTIREAKIIEVPKENVKSWEKTFISKEATEKYMYKSGAAHNLPVKTQERLHKQFEADMSTAPKKVQERKMSTADKVKEFTQKQASKSVEKSKDVEIER